MTESVVAINDLTVRIKNKTILQGLNLTVEKGSFHGIIGPNGAGKTTLFSAIQGFLKPTGGTVALLGSNPYPRNVELLRRIGIQAQSSSFFPKTTMEEHLAIVAELFGATQAKITSLVDQLGLEHALKTKVENLSGGERQRLAVATAVVHEPEVLFLDEPTAGLDPESRHNLVALLRSADFGEMTTLYTTHFLDEAERLCDVISILDEGRIMVTDSPRDLIAKANLGSTIILPRATHQVDVMTELLGQDRVRVTRHGVEVRTDDTAKIFVELDRIGVDTSHAQVRDGRLEEVYLEITGKDLVS